MWQRVVVVRHAQSVNVQRWLEAREGKKPEMVAEPDDHLTELGRTQAQVSAQALLEALKRSPNDQPPRTRVQFCTSPKTRCLETLAVFQDVLRAAGFKGEVRVLDALAELPAKDYLAPSAAALAADDPLEAWQRVVFAPEIDASTLRVVVTHGNVMKQALARRWQWPKTLQLAPPVASFSVLDYNARGETVLHHLCDSGVLGQAVRQWFNEDVFK